MERESFENEDTAKLMNSLFVSIKVDREERPDLDALYMDAVQALTGSGGWPMTVFLTPDGAPYYAGTYFPPEDRYGMPGFPTVLRRLAYYYSSHRDEVEQQAEAFRDFYRERDQSRLRLPDGVLPSQVSVGAGELSQAATHLVDRADTTHGGFGGAPKFPHPMNLEYLLRQASRASGADAEAILAPVRQTLGVMAAGGIYDQIGGGFHRYATDGFAHVVFLKAQVGGDLSGSLCAMKDIVPLEIAGLGNVPELFDDGSVGVAERLMQFGGCPDVELALNALAISILGGVEPASGVGHLTQHVIERLFADTTV
jgi:hypothetical protein